MSTVTPAVAAPIRTIYINPDEKPQGDYLFKKVARIALMILIPLLTAFAIYTFLPLAFSAVLLPISTTGSLIASLFIFGPQRDPLIKVPFDEVFSNAPCGIENTVLDRGANNCWANALAQVMLCDQNLVNWYRNTPNFDDVLLKPALNIPLNEIFVPEDLDLKLAPVVPPPAIPDFAALPPALRHLAVNSVTHIRSLSKAERANILQYLRVIQSFRQTDRAANPLDKDNLGDRENYAKLMMKYGEFFASYYSANGNPTRIVDLSSQVLRTRLGYVTDEVEPDVQRQEDADAALIYLLDLLPPELKVKLEERKVYETGGLPEIQDKPDKIGRKSEINSGKISLPIHGDNPTLEGLLQMYFSSELSDDPVKMKGIDGVDHLYPVKRNEIQFVTAPNSLWIQLMRFDNELNKLDAKVQLPETLQIHPLEGDAVTYQLDGFILHRGSTMRGGHYIAYRKIKDAEGKEVWYEMDDATVRKVDAATLATAKENSYIPHYSRGL